MRGAGFKPGEEGGKVACRREPVEDGEREEHEAEKAGERKGRGFVMRRGVAEDRVGANG